MIFSNWVEQGDLLYIPRGFIAFAKTTDQPSVHVVIRISNKNNSYGAMFKKGTIYYFYELFCAVTLKFYRRLGVTITFFVSVISKIDVS